MTDEVKKHLVDVLKGAVGAAVTAATLAVLQYLGAHIPDLLQLLAIGAGGVAGVKTHV